MSAPKFDPQDMEFKHLGRTGLKVSVFSLGGWLTYGHTVKGDPVKTVMSAAFAAGVNYFDTAENYANGEAEKEMGRVIKEEGWNRREIVVSTKVFFGTGGKDPNNKGLSRKHIVEGVQDSLKRLQMDYVDVVFAHRPDPATPMEETVRAFNYVLDQGWAFYWGTSEWTAQQLTAAWEAANRLGLVGPCVEQPEYNMLNRNNVERDLVPVMEQWGLGTTVFSPLALGLLTGKYNDGIPKGSRFDVNSDFFANKIKHLQSEDGKAELAKIAKLATVSQRLGVSQAQLALAWCAASKNVSTVILGASSPEQLRDNLGALQALRKIREEPKVLDEIDEILGNKPTMPWRFGR